MHRALAIPLALLLIPATSHAARAPIPASFAAGQSVLVASTSPGNVYAAGASVLTVSPIGGDLSAFGGSVVSAATVAGDALIVAGTAHSRAAVGGDLRAVAGSITIEEPVAGDLAALGFTISDLGRAGGDVFVIGANVALTGGAGGAVTVYGNSVSLGGTFAGDVDVVSSGQIILAPNTEIAGKLTYSAPEEAAIPASAVIKGGIAYKNASSLPDVGTSRFLSLLSVALFLLVRVLGALILAGLLAGLFPRLAEGFVARAIAARPTRMLLTGLLGFAIFVATPILCVLLALTFVGLGLAFLFLLLYALIATLALLYAGILIGSLIARRFTQRSAVLWRDGVLGMLVLSLIALIPYVGFLVVFLLAAFSAGTLSIIFFLFAFPHDGRTTELL